VFHTALGLGVTSHSGSTAAARACDPGHWVVDIQSNRIDLKSVVSLLEACIPKTPSRAPSERMGLAARQAARMPLFEPFSAGNKAS
jgi:hypothetical protein